MKPIRLFAILTLSLLAAALSGCAGAPAPAGEMAGPSAGAGSALNTLAILPFENNSVTDPATYAPLSKGLAAMLITDLSNHVEELTLIERDKIQALLQEIALGQTGSVDKGTAIKAGRILGAQTISIGSFMVLGSQVRIDSRIIKVETSEVLMAESITGASADFIGLERELARKIAASLRASYRPKGPAGKSDIQAALMFSKGLDALDRGKAKEADQWFQKSIALDAAYRSQVEAVTGKSR